MCMWATKACDVIFTIKFNVLPDGLSGGGGGGGGGTNRYRLQLFPSPDA